jgi:hypothetical protein
MLGQPSRRPVAEAFSWPAAAGGGRVYLIRRSAAAAAVAGFKEGLAWLLDRCR